MICILAVFFHFINVNVISAVSSNACPTFDEVGATYIDLKKYEGQWFEFMHTGSDYTCSLNSYSGFQNASGYYLKTDYVYRIPNGSVAEGFELADPSSTKEKGYTAYDRGLTGGATFKTAFLDTVYDNYSIELACVEFSSGVKYDLYAQTRCLEMDTYVLQRLEYFNKKLGFGLKININMDECKGLSFPKA